MTAESSVRASLDRLTKTDGALKSFISVFADDAKGGATAQARVIDTGSNGSSKALAGVPVALKDNLCLSWGKTTCASNILRN